MHDKKGNNEFMFEKFWRLFVCNVKKWKNLYENLE